MRRILLLAALFFLPACSEEPPGTAPPRRAAPPPLAAPTPKAPVARKPPVPAELDPAALERVVGRTLPVSEQQCFLLLRLALLRMARGDLEGYLRECRRLPRRSAARRLADRLGRPSRAGGTLVRVRGAEETPGPPRTTRELDPREALRDGIPFVLERLVIGKDGPAVSRTVVFGYLPGLDAYLVRGDPPAVPGDEVETGLLRPLLAGPDLLEGAGPALEAVLDALAASRLAEAGRLAAAVAEEPLARYARVRAALLGGPGPAAKRLLLAGGEDPPPGPAYRLLFAEALLANGEVGRAEQVIREIEAKVGDLSGLPLVRRVRALLQTTPDDDTRTVAALEAILSDHPEERAVWEDVSGLHLASGRYREAHDVLTRMAAALPGVRGEERYRTALRRAGEGVVRTARSARDLAILGAEDAVEVRREAARAATRLEPSEGAGILVRLLGDPDRAVRVLALRGLADLRPAGAAAAVAARLRDEDEWVRGAAAHAIGAISGRRAAPDLAAMLDDPFPYVRRIAVEALRRLSGRRFGYDPDAPEAARRSPARRWTEWSKTETTSSPRQPR